MPFGRLFGRCPKHSRGGPSTVSAFSHILHPEQSLIQGANGSQSGVAKRIGRNRYSKAVVREGASPVKGIARKCDMICEHRKIAHLRPT